MPRYIAVLLFMEDFALNRHETTIRLDRWIDLSIVVGDYRQPRIPVVFRDVKMERFAAMCIHIPSYSLLFMGSQKRRYTRYTIRVSRPKMIVIVLANHWMIIVISLWLTILWALWKVRRIWFTASMLVRRFAAMFGSVPMAKHGRPAGVPPRFSGNAEVLLDDERTLRSVISTAKFEGDVKIISDLNSRV